MGKEFIFSLMTDFRRWWKGIFTDIDGQPSSKRTIAIIAFVLIATAFILNLFLDFTIDEFMWDGMITLVIAGIGFISSEKFTGILGGKKDHNRYEPNRRSYYPYQQHRSNHYQEPERETAVPPTSSPEQDEPPMDTENYEDVK